MALGWARYLIFRFRCGLKAVPAAGVRPLALRWYNPVMIAESRLSVGSPLTGELPVRDLDEIARRGTDLLQRRIEPALAPADIGRFVAVDVVTGAYEVDDDDYCAVMRLRSRVQNAEIWMGRVGQSTADRMGLR
jgi:hypothetical protein